MPTALADALLENTRPGGNAVLESSLTLGSRSSPDAEAKVRRDAETLGIPASVVRESPEVANEVRTKSLADSLFDSPATSRLLSDPDNAALAHDDVENLQEVERQGGLLQKVGDAWKHGRLVHELGRQGFNLKAEGDPEERARIESTVHGIEQEMHGLGVSNDGWTGFLTSAAEIVGQMSKSLIQENTASMVAAGATTGAAAGAVGGPLAPVTSTAGAVSGAVAGLVSHLATDAFVVEAGHSYLELKGMETEEDVAQVLSSGVGFVNAGLEMVGMGLATRPVREALKPKIKRATREVFADRSLALGAAKFAKDWGVAVAGETGTEVMQEAVQMAAEEMARSFGDAEGDLGYDEVKERVEEIAVKTAKGMAVLALPGAGANFVADRVRARKAKRMDEQAEKLMDAVAASKLAERDPELMAGHVAETVGKEYVAIPVEAFEEMREDLQSLDTPVYADAVLDTRGRVSYAEAQQTGGDVQVRTVELAKLMGADSAAVVKKHRKQVRWEEDALNMEEAKEYGDGDLSEFFPEGDLETFLADPGAVGAEGPASGQAQAEDEGLVGDAVVQSVHTDPDMQLAEDSLGLQGLFASAEEAGMSEEQYAAYMTKMQKTADTALNRRKIAQEKREKAQLSREVKAKVAEIKEKLKESIGNEPLYAAIRGLKQGQHRIDRESVLEAFGEEGEAAVAQLRKVGVKVSAKGDETGIHLDEWAELFGFDSGDIMANAMRDAKPEKEEIAERAQKEAEESFPELFSAIAEKEESIEAMLNPDTAGLIAQEIKALSDDKDKRAVTPALVKATASKHMDSHAVGDLSVTRYINNARKWGKEAGKLLKKGDRSGAKNAKVRQMFSIEFAKQVWDRKRRVEKVHKYLKKFGKPTKGLAVGYEEAIHAIVDRISLEPKLTRASREKLENFVAFQQSRGMNFEMPKRLVEDDKLNWRDMTYDEFMSLFNSVRQLEKFGREARAAEEQDRRTLIGLRASKLAASVARVTRTTAGPLDERRATGEKLRATATEAGLLMATPDSILRDMDGDHLGPAYEAVKKAIDLAVTRGYKTIKNMGLLNREKKMAEDVLKLFSVFTSKELNTLGKENVIVPGFAKPLSKNKQLTLLLNAGNEQNLQALYDSEQVTEAQMDSLVANASKRDMDFAQSVWDYLESYWTEIREATERRKGYTPEAVKPRAIKTEHGNYRGGYYFLRYDDDKAINTGVQDYDEAVEQIRYGRATASHTSGYHTEQRKGSGGRPVMLDLGALNSHLSMVAYDLELGDAVNETYAVLHAESTKKAFRDAGRVDTWRALDLWLGDTITGEMHPGGVAEKALRNLRAGFTVSKIGWNVGVTMLQPLGLLQSSVQIGHRHMMPALKTMMAGKWWGEGSMAKEIRAQSEVMNQREETFNKDIANVSRLVQDSWLSRRTSEGFADFVANSMFYAIRKTQYMVDQWTWLAAKRAGMEKFGNNAEQAIAFADRMVLRTQATGVFHERSAFERGTISSKTRQTEMVRAFTPLMSFFIAKMNVAYERTKDTKFTSPVSAAGWAADMTLLFTLEAAMAAFIYGSLPDTEDSENPAGDWMKFLAGETVKSAFAGVPGFREFASEAVGFRGGGIMSFAAEAFGRFTEQAGQGEMDAALVKAANNVGGMLLKYPSGQLNKTGASLHLLFDGEDVSIGELFMGPNRDKY